MCCSVGESKASLMSTVSNVSSHVVDEQDVEDGTVSTLKILML